MDLDFFIIGRGNQSYCRIMHRDFPLNRVIQLLGISRKALVNMSIYFYMIIIKTMAFEPHF